MFFTQCDFDAKRFFDATARAAKNRVRIFRRISRTFTAFSALGSAIPFRCEI